MYYVEMHSITVLSTFMKRGVVATGIFIYC